MMNDGVWCQGRGASWGSVCVLACANALLEFVGRCAYTFADASSLI